MNSIKMDKILENLVGSEDPAASGDLNSSNQEDMSQTLDDMNDVMKVLTGFDDYAEAVGEGGGGGSDASKVLDDTLTSVQDVAKVVDKATLTKEKIAKLSETQIVLERRYADLAKRINRLRCLRIGAHVTEEVGAARDYVEKVTPPPPPMPILPPPSLPPPPPAAALGPPGGSPTPKLGPNFNLGNFRPPIMPEGVALPTQPSPPISLPTQPSPQVKLPTQPTPPPPSVSLPTTPLAPPSALDTKIKEELADQKPVLVKPKPKLPPPSHEDKLKADEALGQLESNLRNLVDSYDSDATESSSGGESCDEFDNFNVKSERTAPIKKRAKWVWLNKRAEVASKWTWLTAQISDLEYRIRQQTDFYRQIRAAKGPVQLGEPTVSWPPGARKAVTDNSAEFVPLSVKPPTRDYSRTDSSGRKIIIKELAPMAISPEEIAAAANKDDDTFTACRTRPIKTLRRRRILGTLGLFKTSTRAAKESTVKCDCIRPHFWCSICFGRSNHIMQPDPVTQDKSRIVALLDHSYHQVLSAPEDIPLDLHMMKMIKNRSWLVSGRDQSKEKAAQEAAEAKKKAKKLKDRKDAERIEAIKHRKRMKRTSEGAPKSKKLKTEKNRRKSVTVHHHADGGTASMLDLTSEDSRDGQTSQQPQQKEAIAEQIRRKRETAFDIDNIVIPYSMAASTRVEILKYKEIQTPNWRLLDNGAADEPDQLKPPPASTSGKKDSNRKSKGSKTAGNNNKSEAAAAKSTDSNNKKTAKEAEMAMITKELAELAASAATTASSVIDDISDSAYELLHSMAEADERKQWASAVNIATSRKSRRLAEASSGYNTPDPMSPGSAVDTLEMQGGTRPSSPEAASTEPSTPTAASIRNRRRTSSVTKVRDRNPSEDQTLLSRCPTPQEDIAPWEPKLFPLSENDYQEMLADMPRGYELGPVTVEPAANAEVNSATSRRESLEENDEDNDDEDWSGDLEDPDDPEWGDNQEEKQTGSTPVPSASSTKSHRRSGSGQQ